jgi:ABC-2 type transport system permease protein
MRTLRFLLEKEFRQIFRNRAILIIIVVMPVMQLIILPFAADYEVKNINLAVVDNDHSDYSRDLVNKITASGYFRLTDYSPSFDAAYEKIAADEADLVLEIPEGFERGLVKENSQQLFIAVNAINGMKAGLGGSYISSIIAEFNGDIRAEMNVPNKFGEVPAIGVDSGYWFNPNLSYKLYMVPGLLAVLVTMVGGFLTALNIVKEKEAGTIEQINVTPIKKHHFILGKMIPFWIIGNVVFTLGLLVGWAVYGIVPAGNIAVLYVFIWVFLLAIVGFGLLVSTYCESQQQAMFILFFFMMVFILMGGLFTPAESMPDWAHAIAKFNPVLYVIDVIRMVVIKGSTFTDVLPKLGIMCGFAIALNGMAVINYKKTG